VSEAPPAERGHRRRLRYVMAVAKSTAQWKFIRKTLLVFLDANKAD
jgi:hypothetical protein